MVLPGGQQIEALIGGGPRIVALERPPERLGGRHVVEDRDPRDPARARQALERDVLSAGVIADGDAHSHCAALASPCAPWFGLERFRIGRDQKPL